MHGFTVVVYVWHVRAALMLELLRGRRQMLTAIDEVVMVVRADWFFR